MCSSCGPLAALCTRVAASVAEHSARRNTSSERVRPAALTTCVPNKTPNRVRSVMIPLSSHTLSVCGTAHPICFLFQITCSTALWFSNIFTAICLIPVIEYVKPVTTFLWSTQKNMKHTGIQTAAHNAQGRQKVRLVSCYFLCFH